MRNIAQLNTARATGGNATVAANVRAALGYAGLKQSALAEVLGLSPMGISRRLADQTDFTANEIVLLADFFELAPGDLFTKRPRPTLVGSDGLEPSTSTVETRGLRPTAIVTDIRTRQPVTQLATDAS